jgi:hypothetical protein
LKLPSSQAKAFQAFKLPSFQIESFQAHYHTYYQIEPFPSSFFSSWNLTRSFPFKLTFKPNLF